MEVFCIIISLGSLVFGPVLAFVAYAVSAERSAQRSGIAWAAATMLLFILLVGSSIAISLSDLLFTFMFMVWDHAPPSMTEWPRLEWLAIPMTKMVAASAAIVGAAWLWPRPRGGYASFPIALVLVALAYETWLQFKH